jgi:hypothetical protein
MAEDGFWAVGHEHVDSALGGLEKAGFSIEVMHVASGKACVLPAFLTSYSENFNSTWNTQNVFGRADPIGAWSNTSRRISIGLGIPSFTPEEAYSNMHQYEHLVSFLYPSYKTQSGVNTMNAYPLVKMKFANFIKNATIEENAVSVLKGGLTGWIENVDFTPNLEAGFHHMHRSFNNNQVKAYNKIQSDGNRKTTNRSHTFIPKVFELNMSFVVVHEHSLGWSGKTWLGGSKTGFPYGYESQSGEIHDVDRGSTVVNNSPMNRIGAPTVSTAAPSQREKTQTQKQSKEVKVKRAEKEATGKNNGVSK